MATWNWSWVNSFETTNRASQSVDDSGGTLYAYRFPTRGPLTAAEARASLDSISTNINHLWRLWRSNIRPVLDSLPSGRRDTRWRTGLGLPEKIDALRYGIQGSTLFVFNDATSTKASGKYWHATDERPITIAEAFEDLWDALNDIETTESTTPTSTDLSPLWYAIGNRYEDISYTSATTSLDYRTGVMENWWSQLQQDLYAPTSFPPYALGVPLSYSVALNIDLLLKAHGITGGWQTNPSGLGHGSFAPGSHTHPYTDIQTTLTIGQSQARVAPLSTLADEVKRIRYELARTRGGAATWYTDPVDPVTSTATGTLYTHMSYGGTGTKTATNPHGITSADLGIDDYFSNIANYIGMSDYTLSIYPTYSSTNYITNGDNITIAIGKLDDAIDSVTGFVFKRIIDFTGRVGSDTELMQSPLTWEHNMGEYPVLQFIDLDAEEHESWGMYSSPTQEVQVDYPNINTVRIWTTATDIRIIGLFGGVTGGPSSGITEYVRSIKAETAGVALYGDVTLIGGSNVTLTRSGQNITIDASGGGGGGYWIESGTALIPYVSTYSVQVGPGTPSAPGLSFSNDTDTGLYRPATNVLSIACSGSQVAYFSSTTISCINPLGVQAGLYDSNRAASTWSSSAIELSANSAEWDNIELLIGSEGSLFASILAAADLARGFTSGSILYAAADGSITEDNSHMHYNPGLSATMTQHLVGTTSASSTIKVEAPNGNATQYIVADSSDTSGGYSTIYLQSTANDTGDNLISLVSGVGGGIINTNGHIRFSNSHRTDWTQEYLLLSDDASDWTGYKYLFGEVSLMAAVIAAASSSGSSYWDRTGTVLHPATVGDTLQVGQGNASAPSYAFEAASSTGIYGSATQIDYSIAGTKYFAMGSTGGARMSFEGYPDDTYNYIRIAATKGSGSDEPYLELESASGPSLTGARVHILATAYNTAGTTGYIYQKSIGESASWYSEAYAEDGTASTKLQAYSSSGDTALLELTADTFAAGSTATTYLDANSSGASGVGEVYIRATAATGNIYLEAGVGETAGTVYFADANKSGWVQNHLLLSDDSSDWIDYKYVFGEVSIMSAIIAAASSGGGGFPSLDDAYNSGYSITVDNEAVDFVVPSGSTKTALTLRNLNSSNTLEVLNLYNNATLSTGYSVYFAGTAGGDGDDADEWGHKLWSTGSVTIGHGTGTGDEIRRSYTSYYYKDDAAVPWSAAEMRAEADTAYAQYASVLVRAGNYGAVAAYVDLETSGYITLTSTLATSIEAGGNLNFESTGGTINFTGVAVLENAAYGSETSVTISSNAIAPNFSTGKDVQLATITSGTGDIDDLTSITAPAGGVAKSVTIRIYNSDSSSHTVGGGTGWNSIEWESSGSDLDAGSITLAASGTALIMLYYTGSAWLGSVGQW